METVTAHGQREHVLHMLFIRIFSSGFLLLHLGFCRSVQAICKCHWHLARQDTFRPADDVSAEDGYVVCIFDAVRGCGVCSQYEVSFSLSSPDLP